jgi:hypothetical protein
VLGVAAGVGAVVAGIAVADSGNPPSAGYVSMTAAKVFSGSIASGKTISGIAIGGVTTVPTNATAVKMTLAITSTQAGILIVYPTSDPTAPDSQNVSYGAGTTHVTIDGTVGAKDEINFHNAGNAAATVTVDDVGYSTQLTATNIAPDGGTSGQVLTNTGNGATWQTPSPAFIGSGPGGVVSAGDTATVGSLTVPAGDYVVTAMGDAGLQQGTAAAGLCELLGPGNDTLQDGEIRLTPASVDPNEANVGIALQGVLSTSGGTITLQCDSQFGGIDINGDSSIIATRVGSITGS